VLIQSYLPGKIENKLYKMNSVDLRNLQPVPLDTIQQTSMLQDVIPHPFGENGMFVIKDDPAVLYPKHSALEKEQDKIYDMERMKVMFSTQFLQNVESFVAMKGINLPKKVMKKYTNGQRLDFADLGRFVELDKDGSIEFINNTNSLIKDAMESMNTNLKQLSASSKIPLDFLGADTAH